MDQKKVKHDSFAPFWAIALVLFGSIGLSTAWFDLGPFWKGYVLDITGPAWNYILFRGLFTSYAENAWTRFFTPKRTFSIFLGVCIGIEMAQYFRIYDGNFDPLDLIAYVSLLVPIFILDLRQTRKKPIP